MSDATVTQSYRVSGMTCGHCVSAVTDEVAAIPGVQSVQVDLASGAVTIVASAPVDDAVVAAAVDEAGYEVLA